MKISNEKISKIYQFKILIIKMELNKLYVRIKRKLQEMEKKIKNWSESRT